MILYHWSVVPSNVMLVSEVQLIKEYVLILFNELLIFTFVSVVQPGKIHPGKSVTVLGISISVTSSLLI